jgi:exodeoxyribonuclease-1
MAGIWPEVFQRQAPAVPPDVDEDLYGGFLSNADRALLNRLRQKTPEQLAAARPAFDDARLEELLFRYRARNFPATLGDAERERWRLHCIDRLVEGRGAISLAAFQRRVDELRVSAGDRAQALLSALADYGRAIAPDQPGVQGTSDGEAT